MHNEEKKACDDIFRYLKSESKCMIVDGKRQRELIGVFETVAAGLGATGDDKSREHDARSLFPIPAEVVRQIIRGGETPSGSDDSDCITDYTEYVRLVSKWGMVVFDVSDRTRLWFLGRDRLDDIVRGCINCRSFPGVVAKMLDYEFLNRGVGNGVLPYYYRWFPLHDWFTDRCDKLTFGKTLKSPPVYACSTRMISNVRHYFGILCTHFHATMLLHAIVCTVVDQLRFMIEEDRKKERWGVRNTRFQFETTGEENSDRRGGPEATDVLPSSFLLFIWSKYVLDTSVEIDVGSSSGSDGGQSDSVGSTGGVSLGTSGTASADPVWKRMDQPIFPIGTDLFEEGSVSGVLERGDINEDRCLTRVTLPKISPEFSTYGTDLVFYCVEIFRILVNGIFVLKTKNPEPDPNRHCTVVSEEVTKRLVSLENRKDSFRFGEDGGTYHPDFNMKMEPDLCHILQHTAKSIFALPCGGFDLSLRRIFHSYFSTTSEEWARVGPERISSDEEGRRELGAECAVVAMVTTGVLERTPEPMMNTGGGLFRLRKLRVTKTYNEDEWERKDEITDFRMLLFACSRKRESVPVVSGELEELFCLNLMYNAMSPMDVAATMDFYTNRFPFFSGEDYEVGLSDLSENEVVVRSSSSGVGRRIRSFIPVWMHYAQIEPRNCMMSPFLYRNYIRSIETNDCAGLLTVAESLYLLCGGEPTVLLFSKEGTDGGFSGRPAEIGSGGKTECGMPSMSEVGDRFVVHMAALPKFLSELGAVAHIGIPYTTASKLYGTDGSGEPGGMNIVIPTIFSAVRVYLAVERDMVIPREILVDLCDRILHIKGSPSIDSGVLFFWEYVGALLGDKKSERTSDIPECDEWVVVPGYYNHSVYTRSRIPEDERTDGVNDGGMIEGGSDRSELSETRVGSGGKSSGKPPPPPDPRDCSPLGRPDYEKFRFVPIRILYYRAVMEVYKTSGDESVEGVWFMLSFFRPRLLDEMREFLRPVDRLPGRPNRNSRRTAGASCSPPELPFRIQELDLDVLDEVFGERGVSGTGNIVPNGKEVPVYKHPVLYDFISGIELLCHLPEVQNASPGERSRIDIEFSESPCIDVLQSLPAFETAWGSEDGSVRDAEDLIWYESLEEILRGACAGITTINPEDTHYCETRRTLIATPEKYDVFPVLRNDLLTDDVFNVYNHTSPLFGEGNGLSFIHIFAPVTSCPVSGFYRPERESNDSGMGITMEYSGW